MANLLSQHLPKIAVLRALQLGDLLCAVPALRALRAAFPAAEISLIGLPWAQSFVARFQHLVDRAIDFPGYPGLPEQPPQVRCIPGFLRAVQRERFDLAIQLHGSGSFVNPLIMLLDAERTGGYYVAGEWQPDSPLFMPYPEGIPEPRRHLRLMEFFGIPTSGENLEFPLGARDLEAFMELAGAHDLLAHRYICLHPGSRSALRRLPLEQFAAAANVLGADGWHLVLTGSETERSLCDTLAGRIAFPCINLAGRTDLGALGALVRHARLLICNDTGVSHIAAALRTPSVIVFTGSDPERWAPLDRHRHRRVRASAHPGADNAHHEIVRHARELLEEEVHHAPYGV